MKMVRFTFENWMKSREPEHMSVTPAARPVPDVTGPWSSECTAFLEHWSSLRRGQAVPTSEDFLDHPSPRFAATTFIFELLDEFPIVRLQGTQLEQDWGQDLTGQDLYPGRSQRFRENAIASLRTLLAHPCGQLVRVTYATSKGRKITADGIKLPLAVQAGRPPRIVGAMFELEARDRTEAVAMLHVQMHRSIWLDIGHGVPVAPPAPLLD